MCGFVGGIYPKDRHNIVDLLKDSSSLLTHRGPDQEGYTVKENDNFIYAVAHRRLSIIDLSEDAIQPMFNDKKSNIIAYNGELYNYVELREELSAIGIKFHTKSDTEVVLKSLECWGMDALSKFNGMFSFAYFDNDKKEVLLARDQYGIKPLYFFHDKKSFSFGSEIPCLLRISNIKVEANDQSIHSYLMNGVNNNIESTFFKNIQSVNPGHAIKVNFNRNSINKIEKINWYQKELKTFEKISFEEAAENVKNCFIDEVKIQLRSDVPIALTLSGGIDSSAIACVVRKLKPKSKIKTFSYDSCNKSNSETVWFKKINDYINAEPNIVNIEDEDFIEDLNELISSQAEPFVSTSIYAQFKVHKAISKEGIKVVLGGQGADEIFAGYSGYPYHTFNDYLDNFGIFKAINFLFYNKKLFKNSVLPIFLSSFAKRLKLSNFFKSKKSYNQFDFVDFNFHEIDINLYKKENSHLQDHLYSELTKKKIPVLLRYEDRNSMKWSVESRVPFLNPNLVDLTSKLPFHFLVSNKSVTKNIFREAMKGIVPKDILERKDKIGFETPEKDLIYKNWSILKESISKAKDIPYINKSKFLQYVSEQIKSNTYNPIIWRVINLYLWTESFKVEY